MPGEILHPTPPHITSPTRYLAFCFDDSAFEDGTSRSTRNVGQRGVAASKSEDFVPTDIKILKIVSLDSFQTTFVRDPAF